MVNLTRASAGTVRNETLARVRYSGAGFIFGIPAADMTPGEYEGLTLDQQAAVMRSGIYAFEFIPAPSGVDEVSNG